MRGRDTEDLGRGSDAGKTGIQGVAVMAKKNPHLGSSFESWLEDGGIREEVTAAAIKAVIARQLASEMKKKKISKQRMAELMKTSRAQVDRLLDPDNGSATIESLQRAAKIVGRELRLQLVRRPGFAGIGLCLANNQYYLRPLRDACRRGLFLPPSRRGT